ncbi:hypothetical protein RYX36_014766 [Vicia faba]
MVYTSLLSMVGCQNLNNSKNSSILAPTFYIFFSSALSVIAFGEQLSSDANGSLGTVETLASTAICGIIHSICVITQLNYLNKVVISELMKLASGNQSLADQLNVDAFLEQAQSYEKTASSPVRWYIRFVIIYKLVCIFFDGKQLLVISMSKSPVTEEIAEIEKMHDLMKQYNLNGDFQCITAQTTRACNNELYRYIVYTKGAFIQPATRPYANG